MKKSMKILFLTLCTMVITFSTVFASSSDSSSIFPDKPTNDIYVVDQAEVIKPETKSQILSIARDLNSKTKAQIVVVTVKSLHDRDIESYSNELFRSWGIGDKEKSNGILFLVAPNDRKMRIEVGRGLEGRIPDMVAGRIMDEYAKPYFSKKNFDEGILNTFKALATEVSAEYNTDVDGLSGDQQAKTLKQSHPSLLDSFLALSLWMKFVIIIVIIIVVFLMLQLGIFPFFFFGGGNGGDSGFGGGGSSGGGSSDGW